MRRWKKSRAGWKEGKFTTTISIIKSSMVMQQMKSQMKSLTDEQLHR